jgi:ATP-dependent RNA helicase DDX52/ROK1
VSLIEKESLSLHTVSLLVMDEADKLLELGFLEQVDAILAACSHAQLQRCLFSATMLPVVEDLAATVLRHPIKIVVGAKNAAAETVAQRLLFCGREEGKLLALRSIVKEGLTPPVLVFVQSKERAMQLFHELVYDNLNVDVMHAERTQQQRDHVVEKFRTGKVWVLVCTELMARGIDFKGVNTVINYDFPQTTVSYIHRIGRTGRAGRSGRAITFFTEEDAEQLRAIANVMKASGCEVADWMLRMQPMRRDKRKQLATKAKSRVPIRKKLRKEVWVAKEA